MQKHLGFKYLIMLRFWKKSNLIRWLYGPFKTRAIFFDEIRILKGQNGRVNF